MYPEVLVVTVVRIESFLDRGRPVLFERLGLVRCCRPCLVYWTLGCLLGPIAFLRSLLGLWVVPLVLAFFPSPLPILIILLPLRCPVLVVRSDLSMCVVHLRYFLPTLPTLVFLRVRPVVFLAVVLVYLAPLVVVVPPAIAGRD